MSPIIYCTDSVTVYKLLYLFLLCIFLFMHNLDQFYSSQIDLDCSRLAQIQEFAPCSLQS